MAEPKYDVNTVKKIYKSQDYATLQHQWRAKRRRVVEVSPKDHAVKDSLTMFDVEEVWRSLSADDKAIVRDTVATGQSIYHKEVVNYVNDKQVHQKAADKYLQAVAELFAGEAEQAGMKSHTKPSRSGLMSNSMSSFASRVRPLPTARLMPA